MLSDEDWEFLRQLVLEHWFLEQEPVALVRQHFRDTEFLARVEIVSGPPVVRAANLLLAVQQAGSALHDSPIRTLIDGLKGTARITVNQELLSRLDALQSRVDAFAAASAAADPYSTYLLTGNRVFIDRSDLRSSLKHLTCNTDKLVMRVMGKEKSGTSYTKELVMHLAATQRYQHAYVDLLDFPTPREAIGYLALAIKGDVQPPEVEGGDLAKWTRVATRWLISLAHSTSLNWWFVLDQCNHVQQDKPLVDMINRLAEQIRQNTRPGLKIRLLLLGHQSDLTDDLRGRILDDETRALTLSDVRQALRTVASNVAGPNGAPGVSADELERRIDSIATDVWAAATQSGQLVGRDLTIALEEAIDEHFLQGV